MGLITDTPTLMLPASSRPEYVVELKPSVTSTGERVAHSISVMQSRTIKSNSSFTSILYVIQTVFPLPEVIVANCLSIQLWLAVTYYQSCYYALMLN